VVGTSVTQAARWIFNSGIGPTTLELLGTLGGGTSSQAQTVSQDGSIIFGRATTSAGVAGAFRWIDLGAPLTTVPVPAAVWLFGSGLLGLIGVARRKKA